MPISRPPHHAPRPALPLAFAAAAVTLTATLAATPASAHHPLGGQAMTTFGHGLLSGLGHPILGFDHLFFVVAVGVAAALAGRAWTAPLAFIAAMLAGVGLVVAGIALPLVEPAIALSLLILGALVMAGGRLSVGTVAGLIAVAGLFHGWAFGAALAGQEAGAAMPVAAGYLLGLGLVQYAIAVAAGLGLTAAATRTPARLAGAMVAGVGAFLTLEIVEGAAFAALGLG